MTVKSISFENCFSSSFTKLSARSLSSSSWSLRQYLNMSHSSSINLLHYHYLPPYFNHSLRFSLTSPSSSRWSSPDDYCSFLAMPTTTLPGSISPFNVPHSVVSLTFFWIPCFVLIIHMFIRLMIRLHTTWMLWIFWNQYVCFNLSIHSH